jgi:hypothetical protein
MSVLAGDDSTWEPLGEMNLRHHYELQLSAAEEDPLQARKESLLASCALDGPIFLTVDILHEVQFCTMRQQCIPHNAHNPPHCGMERKA